MRRLRFLPIGLLVLLSCSKETVKEPVNREMGEVCITLSSTGDGEDVRPKTRSVEENVPDAGDFEVEIYNSQGIRIYRDNYANSAGKKIPLNSGEYRLLAQHGDSAGVGFGSEKAWFSADQTFTVRPQTSESVSAVARMNKVKVAVSLGPNLLASYSDLYTVVRNAGSSKELKFVKDETRAGYILPGVLEMEIYALVDSEWKYYPVDLGSLSDTEDMSVYAPNTFVSFNLELYSGEGSLGGTVIEVDVTTDDVTKEFLVPVEAAPKDAPAAAMYGFTDNLFSFIEGVDYENVQIDLIAKGGIKSCTLNVMESPYLEGKGITGSIDLVSPDPAVQETLESLGFNWVKSMKDKRLGSIDFSRLSDYIKYEPSNAFSGKFSVTVTDNLDRSASTPEFTIAQNPVEFSFSPADYNAFARRIRGLAATTVNGNPAKIEVQYSTDGRSWTSVEPMSADAAKAIFPDIAGLEPGSRFGFTLTPAEGYGEIEPDRIIDLPKEAFEVNGTIQENLLVPGTTVPMLNGKGGIVPGKILEVHEKTVKMDLNSPMAGKTLNFSGEIISVREATEKELKEGLHGEYVHSCCCGGHGEGHGHGDGCCGGHGEGHGHGDGCCGGHGEGHGHGDGCCGGHGEGHGHGDGCCGGHGEGHGHGDGCCGGHK